MTPTKQDILRAAGIYSRARPAHPEHDMQVAIFRWADMAGATRPELRLLFAIPNGGARDSRTGAMLKAEGVKAGVPDMCLPVPRGPYHGLYIELKTPQGRVSEAQDAWHKALREQGYRVEVCRSIADAVDTLDGYINS